jgi:hypothetical protein
LAEGCKVKSFSKMKKMGCDGSKAKCDLLSDTWKYGTPNGMGVPMRQAGKDEEICTSSWGCQ